ncbi:DUF5129 domain-containing protein [Zafaria sp. Z1313]|uniref:DUF5129 domain-containing protein n=1 Tax=Zafaria sp. Z1313 TaxID=3423202 RepID=UPI003D303965
MRSTIQRLALAAVVALAALFGLAPAASAAPPTEVVVEDTAGVLDRATLDPALAEVDFYSPTKVVVFTQEGRGSDNFNERVLAYAREHHPEWLSADGQKWADGLYLVGLDPVGRHIGTYMGDDRAIPLSQREDIQESTFDLLRDAQWTDGMIKAVEEGAQRIDRPWYRSPALYVAAGSVGGVALIGGGGALAVRASYRRQFGAALERGDASYRNVTLDLEATELHARTIPDSSRYGALVLERYRDFHAKYDSVHARRGELTARTPQQRSTKKSVNQAKAWADDAVTLDGLDDAIRDTNDLLNKNSRWAEAWRRQAEPFSDELETIDTLFTGDNAELRGSATGVALTGFALRSLQLVEDTGAELAEDRITPDDALDRLRDARTELSELLSSHAEAVIEQYTKSSSEAETMRQEMDKAQKSASRTPRRSGVGILDTAYPGHVYYSLPAFSLGYQSGTQQVDSSRVSASSSSTGYGSSGGSFSGSGSSSRF